MGRLPTIADVAEMRPNPKSAHLFHRGPRNSPPDSDSDHVAWRSRSAQFWISRLTQSRQSRILDRDLWATWSDSRWNRIDSRWNLIDSGWNFRVIFFGWFFSDEFFSDEFCFGWLFSDDFFRVIFFGLILFGWFFSDDFFSDDFFGWICFRTNPAYSHQWQ